MRQTLKRFYELMESTVEVRRRMVLRYLDKGTVQNDDVSYLRQVLETLEAVPVTDEGKRVLMLEGDRGIEVDIGYETGELLKDILFFEKGEDEFAAYVESIHPGFADFVDRGVSFLADKHFTSFVTDRDGTVNNYCGRYRSSIQSAYNAVFLTRFIRNCTNNSMIITSAPLQNPGIVTLSVMPPGTFVYAASKAREFVDRDGVRRTYPVDPKGQLLLNDVNKRLVGLIQEPGNEKYGLIGSGLQFKFGETTLARQDITGAVTEEESSAFMKRVEEIVREIDPSSSYFSISDTGLDIEIVLRKGSGDDSGSKQFHKGDGMLFLDAELGLNFENGPNLVCGDTGSDMKLVEASMSKCSDTWTVFVTEEDDLIERVKATGAEAFIVPEPDILLFMFDHLSRKGASYE